MTLTEDDIMDVGEDLFWIDKTLTKKERDEILNQLEKARKLDYLMSYYMCNNYEQLKELFEKRSHELIESWKLREGLQKLLQESQQ